MPREKTPQELACRIPEPHIVLMGCRPLVPYRGFPGVTPSDSYPTFHVPEPSGDTKPKKRRRPVGPNFPTDTCPVCRGKIGLQEAAKAADHISHRTYCEFCGSLSPRNEAKAEFLRENTDSRESCGDAKQKAIKALESASGGFNGQRVQLTECERRRIWNGYKGGILKELDGKVTNLAKTGRDFLRSINQVPNWEVKLDRRGYPVETPSHE